MLSVQSMNYNRTRPVPDFGDFRSYIEKHDYVGALTILDFGEVELNPIDRNLGVCQKQLSVPFSLLFVMFVLDWCFM